MVTVGWMLQTPAPLTPAQIEAARQAALATGATVQTKSGELGLSQISQGATLTLTFGNVSPLVFLLLMVGMPLIAAIAGWLLGGREPRAFARQPLE